MGAKSTRAEVARRIDAVYELVLQGVTRRGIAAYAAQHGWGVSPRQLDTYTARARKLLSQQAERDRDEELGTACAQLDLLFRKALAAEDRPEARLVLAQRIELLGLAAARRHELAGPGGAPLGGTIAERAERFLAEFEPAADPDEGKETP